MAALNISSLVVSPSDVSHLQREIIGLNDFFVAARARQTGTNMPLPKLTRVLNQVAKDNGVNLLDDTARQKLADARQLLYERAPTLHVSFATEPSPKALERLVVWIRTNIHPQALVQVGLQPSIAAGCFPSAP